MDDSATPTHHPAPVDDDGGITPPTPLADEPPPGGDPSNGEAAHPKSPDDEVVVVVVPSIPEERDETIGKVSAIGERLELDKPALSPPASVSSTEVIPQISTLTEVRIY